MEQMPRYMCSRFFIDYKTIPEQTHVITQYIATHFLPSSVTNITHTNVHQQHQEFNSRRPSKYSRSNSANDPTDLINARLCFNFLDHLSHTIFTCTVCLTRDDKNATLMLIDHLKQQYRYEYRHLIQENHHPQRRNYYHHHHHHQHHPHAHHYSSSSSNSSRSVGVILHWYFELYRFLFIVVCMLCFCNQGTNRRGVRSFRWLKIRQTI